MKLIIIAATLHTYKDEKYFAYSPYVREMDIWSKYVDEVAVLAPLSSSNSLRAIDSAYYKPINFTEIKSFNILNAKGVLRTVWVISSILFKIFKTMKKADHIHLRCPSNVSLLGCFVQILFPKKSKTTKYAGNWDPQSKQPWSYKLQQKILSNTFLTRNMKVLAYGEWKDHSKNIVPFISATYFENEKLPWYERNYNEKLVFVFIGSMVVGKRPILTIQIIESLITKGINVELHMFGDGNLIEHAKNYVYENNLESKVFIHGNKTKQVVKEALQKAHFGILPSKSEGWPKAIAEAMFFGAIPISTRISCLAWMLDEGKRGIIIEPELESSVNAICKHLDHKDLAAMSRAAQEWSQQFTLDTLDLAIKKLLED